MENNFPAVYIFYIYFSPVDLSSVCWTFISHSFSFTILHCAQQKMNFFFMSCRQFIPSHSLLVLSFFYNFTMPRIRVNSILLVFYWRKGEKENKCCCCFSTVSGVCRTEFCWKRLETADNGCTHTHTHTKNDAVLLLNDNWVQWTFWLEQ